MTERLYFDPQSIALSPGSVSPGVALEVSDTSIPAPSIDLTNFAHWLELNQPVSTLAGMIDLIGSELYRRHWPTYGAECRLLASQLRTTVKYLAKEREPDDIDAYKRAREEERP